VPKYGPGINQTAALLLGGSVIWTDAARQVIKIVYLNSSGGLYQINTDSGNIGNVVDDISSGADGKKYGSDCEVECVA